MQLKERYAAGDTLKVWSHAVFGVPVQFTVERVGRQYLYGTFSYGMTTWYGRVAPANVISQVCAS